MKLLHRISPRNRILDHASSIADEVIALEETYGKLTDQELRDKTDDFITRLDNNATLDDIIAEAFANAREIIYRTFKQRAFRVQLIGAAVAHFGDFAEMMTGEGKTLTLLLVSYLDSLLKKGVHIVTVNEYLVQRDAEYSAKALNRLGVSVGYITSAMSNSEKQNMYNCDITYAPNSEIGFDYLRDNMARNIHDKVQRGLHFAIVDEGDSILIDEARTPLIISGQPKNDVSLYMKVDRFIAKLDEDDYLVDPESNSITLSDYGVDKAQEYFEVKNIYDIENSDIVHKMVNALRAHYVFENGKEYIVKQDKNGQDIIALVDQFTGRVLEGRSYNAGLQQAIQVKERVKIDPENITVATITYQSLFRQYNKLSAVSGTALTESEEFMSIYNMVVVPIPTNRPLIRLDHPDYIFGEKKTKWKYVIADIIRRHKTGQPILVGTASVDDSEILHQLLLKVKVPHEVLNAKNHAREAEIIGKAGELDSITIATNMAGRGTDIKLGKGVIEAGGLFVLGTERHESRRIDNQLRGRSGRQGDIGESRFFISLQDSLFKRFATDKFDKAQSKLGDDYIDVRFFGRLLNNTQKKVEGINFDVRKNLIDYDHVLSSQRELIYKQRDQILKAKNLVPLVKNMAKHVITDVVDLFRDKENSDIVNIDKLVESLNEKIFMEQLATTSTLDRHKPEQIKITLTKLMEDWIEAKAEELTIQVINPMLRDILIRNIDESWTQHLDNVMKLREGVNLRAYEQKSPLNIYVNDADRMFNNLKNNTAHKTIVIFGRMNNMQQQTRRNPQGGEEVQIINGNQNAPSFKVSTSVDKAPTITNDNVTSDTKINIALLNHLPMPKISLLDHHIENKPLLPKSQKSANSPVKVPTKKAAPTKKLDVLNKINVESNPVKKDSIKKTPVKKVAAKKPTVVKKTATKKTPVKKVTVKKPTAAKQNVTKEPK